MSNLDFYPRAGETPKATEQNTERDIFHRWEDFMAAALGPSQMETRSRASRRAASDFTDHESWNETLSYAKDGYNGVIPDTDRIVSQITRTVFDERESRCVRVRMDIAGGTQVDPGRMAAGHPKMVRRIHREPTNRAGRVVRILVPTCYSSGVRTETIRRRGAAVTALIEAMRVGGYALEVWAVSAIETYESGAKKERYACSVLAQDPTQPTDMGRIMFAIANPNMLRRLVFSLEETKSASFRRKHGVGMGYGAPSFAAIPEDVPMDTGAIAGTIILPTLQSSHVSWEDDAAVVGWINEQIDLLESPNGE